MNSIKAYTHQEREDIIQKLIPIIKIQLGNNFIALAAAGSYARGEDGDFSDLELIVFVKDPLKEPWEIRKIVKGLYIIVIVDTKESYIHKYLDISNIWYASGAEKLLPILNEEYIHEINNFKPFDTYKKCLTQIENRWHLFQEITSKTLNTIKKHNRDGFPIIFNQMIKELLIILSYLNVSPFTTLGNYISEAKQFPLKPQGFDDLIDIAINGNYQDMEKMTDIIVKVFSDLEKLIELKGLKLYSENI